MCSSAQIVGYHQVRKNTVLLVSHSMEDIARTAEKILVMNDSKAAMFDSTEKVFARDRELEEMGLRVPEITKIMARLKEKGWPVGTALTMEQALRQLLPLAGERRRDGMIRDIALGQYIPGKSCIHRDGSPGEDRPDLFVYYLPVCGQRVCGNGRYGGAGSWRFCCFPAYPFGSISKA